MNNEDFLQVAMHCDERMNKFMIVNKMHFMILKRFTRISSRSYVLNVISTSDAQQFKRILANVSESEKLSGAQNKN